MQLRDRRNLELPTQLTPPQQAGSGANDLAQRYELAPSKPNNTGLPDNLTSGIESLSGMSMDHVKVHYHSAKPVQLNAHAYAQGSEIHVAPGQERHLAHEAWHVVQQARGRVKPTMQMRQGVPLQRLAIRHGLLAPGAYAAVVGWSVLAYATLTRPGLAPQHSTARSGAAGHAEEQLIAGAQALLGGPAALAPAGTEFEIWVSSSPCSSMFGTSALPPGCMERLQAFAAATGATVIVHADKPYQPKGVGMKAQSVAAAGALAVGGSPIDFSKRTGIAAGLTAYPLVAGLGHGWQPPHGSVAQLAGGATNRSIEGRMGVADGEEDSVLAKPKPGGVKLIYGA